MLFETPRQPLHLTPVGRELLSLTRRMFATSEEIDGLLGDHAVCADMSIQLVSDSPTYAARLAQALLADQPEAVVEVHIGNSRETLARLIEARADVAIASDPPIDPRFAYQPLFIDYLKVVLPASHRLARAAMVPLAALAEETLLLREATSKTRAATESLLRAHDIRPRRIVELHSREAIREAVALGMGISLFFSAECPPDTRLRALPPDCQPDPALLTGYIVCSVDRRRSLFMRSVLQAAATLEPLSPIPIGAMLERHAVATPGGHKPAAA